MYVYMYNVHVRCTFSVHVHVYVCPRREWYHISAVLLLPSLTQRILSALYDLSEVTFDLTLEGVELDEHWPSFTL
jgi:hypothetical protein